jgi:putative membrane-bound dehydrogenase-like protein
MLNQPAKFTFIVTALVGTTVLSATEPSPADALARMRVAEGLEVTLVAHEPAIRQPISMAFDARARLWVVQYLQFPEPAGLKVVSADEYMRTVYDRVPEPPPRGPKGADLITVCEDQDGDGRMDTFKTFVSGLNLATGLALGYDGVYVLQAPYLLFYPDRNHDDVPDGDPEVLLSGFGLQDTHSLVNSLQWGPDGWLYAAQGSTVVSNVQGIEFNQGIWRFHPLTKKFELFAEGGGNTWGLDFDRHGDVIAGTNYEKAALHQVQGGAYIKIFGKHGPLKNPYAFGYFDHIPVDRFKGGHVTVGGIVYEGSGLPEEFRGTYIAGNTLANAVYWHTFERDGSSFKMKFGGDLLVTDDTRFRPVDCLTGPDGAVYIADWATRVSWPPTRPPSDASAQTDPRDDWNRSHGRIYKVQGRGAQQPSRFNLASKSSAELVELLRHPNQWFTRMARQILTERRDSTVYGSLKKNVRSGMHGSALESFWALASSGGLDEEFALETLMHPNEDVRAWTVRLLADANRVSPTAAARFEQLAKTDSSPVVRSQLASSAKRLNGQQALPVVRGLLHRREDVHDPHIPLLLWWAVENKAVSDREAVVGLLGDPTDWQAPLLRTHIVERLSRRYAAEETDENFATCGRLLSLAPGPAEVDLLLRGMEKAFEGRVLPEMPVALRAPLEKLWNRGAPSPSLVRFTARLGDPRARAKANALILDSRVPGDERLATITLLGQVGDAKSLPALVRLLETKQAEEVQLAALAALQSYSDADIAEKILRLYSDMNGAMKTRARMALAGRSSWALALLRAVDESKIKPEELLRPEISKLSTYDDPEISSLVLKHWGRATGSTTVEQRTLLNAFRSILKEGQGNASQGRVVFQAVCATCHSLFGEGGSVGPNLTSADRRNTVSLLENILSPSLAIRPEYLSYNVELVDGRALNGFLAEATEQAVTVVDVAGQRTVVARQQINNMAGAPMSIMPPGLLEALSPQQVRDLFAYLQSN